MAGAFYFAAIPLHSFFDAESGDTGGIIETWDMSCEAWSFLIPDDFLIPNYMRIYESFTFKISRVISL